jgi:serpin B
MSTSRPMIAVVLFAGVAAGCADTPEPGPEAAPGIVAPPTVVAEDKGSVVQASNAFAFNLYANLRGQKGNLFFSPESISTGLSMAWCGARGETADQIASVLGYRTDRPITPERFAAAYGEHLAKLFSHPKGYELLAANALWGQKGYPFVPYYLTLLGVNYGASFEEADFAGDREGARKAINDWVKQRTGDKIDQLVGPEVLQPLTRLVLVNAIYFKARWTMPFHQSSTKPGDFYPPAGRAVSVPMMHQTARYRYAEDDQMQVLEMSYLRDEAAMVIILPKKRDGLRGIEGNITAAKVGDWISQLRDREIAVTFPKFVSTSTFSLRKTLAGMGMPLAFGAADFSGINGGKEAISLQAVLHKAYVNVSEEGTEAAAATAMSLAACEPPPLPVVFRADHPFIFLIRDKRSGCILFLGRVVNPKE